MADSSRATLDPSALPTGPNPHGNPPEELCDTAFHGSIMQDPVIASDGFTYEREAIRKWMETNDTSPRTGEPLEHKMLMPNMMARQLIAAWCRQNGVDLPTVSLCAAKPVASGAGAGVAAMPQQPRVTCATHPKELLRVFCKDCGHGVCVFCAVDTERCKAHFTKAFEPLVEELKTEREELARVQQECIRSAEQLCGTIQANADSKIQAIIAQATALQRQVRAATEARATALGALVEKRKAREKLVAEAASSPDFGVKGSAAASAVASALSRVKGTALAVCAAEFRAAPAPAAPVGEVVVATALADPEEQPLAGSPLLQRVDANRLRQFATLISAKLPGKGYRLLFTWSRDGQSNAAFHQRCDDQGPTLVIVRSTTGHTFGGYASASWTSVNGWQSTAGCFLFFVENPHNDAPTCFDCSNSGYAMYCSSAHGPSFGGGHDLTIQPGGDGAASYTGFPHSYSDTLGRVNATFTGAQQFTVEDFEAWAVS